MVYQEYSGLGRQGFSPSLQYLYDTVSGVYRPVRATDFANATISVTGNVSIDDFITLSGNSSVGITGGYIGISGTANVNVTNAVLAVSGIANISNTILAVSGATNSTIQNALLATSGNSTIINNVAVNGAVGITGQPIYTTGTVNSTIQNALLAVSGNSTVINNVAVNGAVGITGQPINVTGYNFPVGATTVSNSTVSGSNGTVLAANSNRKSFFVQNNGTGNAVFVAYVAGASTAVRNIVLKPGTAADDGLGGSLTDDIWKGIVSVSGVTPRFDAWEIV